MSLWVNRYRMVGRVITHSDVRAAHAGKSRIHNWASYVFENLI